MPGRGHRHHELDLDRPAADDPCPWRSDGQEDQGQARPPGSHHRGDPALVAQRVLAASPDPDARLFTGPRGGRISTAVLRDATHWDEVVSRLGYEHLRRHDLRHTGLTWFADAGVPVHVLRKIAGHGSLTTTQRYLHPDLRQITAAGAALTAHLSVLRAPRTLPTAIAVAR
ncbi:tyrosine-type recombinase/integrase [Streptomyces sp. SBR177]